MTSILCTFIAASELSSLRKENHKSMIVSLSYLSWPSLYSWLSIHSDYIGHSVLYLLITVIGSKISYVDRSVCSARLCCDWLAVRSSPTGVRDQRGEEIRPSTADQCEASEPAASPRGRRNFPRCSRSLETVRVCSRGDRCQLHRCSNNYGSTRDSGSWPSHSRFD